MRDCPSVEVLMRTVLILSDRSAERGGLTILVALMLLVLLTVAAMGMSRNALRDMVTTGFGRQGAAARHAADSGLAWSVFWMDPRNGPLAPAGTSAARLQSLRMALLQNESLSGMPQDLRSQDPIQPSPYSAGGELLPDLRLVGPSGTTLGTTLGLTRMGQLPMANISQGAGPGAFTPAAGQVRSGQAPDLWAIRSDAQVIQGPVTFTHAREAWMVTPAQ